MPSYKTHLIFNLIVLSFLSYFLARANIGLANMLVIFAGFFIGTCWITPDLDTDSTPFRRVPLLWVLYAFFSKHRGNSHKIILGSLVQLAYLISIFIAIFALAGKMDMLYGIYVRAKTIKPEIYILAISSLIFANFLHILLDWLRSCLLKIKRVFVS